MSKKTLLFTILSVIGLILLCFFLVCFHWERAAASRRNVILIVADALRFDVLGCYGGDAGTPNIDWLARNGTLFENAYSTAPCTESSVVSMLTGNYSTGYKVINNKNKGLIKTRRIYSFYVNETEKLLAETLGEMGFDVLVEVENHIAERSNILQGFEKLRDFEQMSSDELALVEKATGINVCGWEDGKKLLHRLYSLLHYLLTVDRHQNFFIMKWFLDPHIPYNPIKKYRDKISVDSSRLPLDRTFYPKKQAVTFWAIQRKRGLTDYEYYYLKELYKAEVESIDERVGFILKAIKNRRLLDRTIIIFTTDHGESFGENGYWGHGNHYYETLIHIPLIIVGPGIPKGRRVKTKISNLGLMPTLRDLLKVEHTAMMQGTSFRSLLYDEVSRHTSLFFDGNNKNLMASMKSHAFMMNGFKLVTNRQNKDRHHELFNLKIDPGEEINIVGDHPGILEKMLYIMEEIQNENEQRRKYNLSKIGGDVNLSEEWEKTQQKLRALGYID